MTTDQTAHQITEAQAREIMGDDNAEYVPFRVINKSGKKIVNDWTMRVGNYMHTAWLEDAEHAANDAVPGEATIIEMRGMDTLSGVPETLAIEDSCFDWMINE